MSATEPADATVIDADGHEVEHDDHVGAQSQSTTAALAEIVKVPVGALMRPIASVEQTRQAFAEYQKLRDTIIVSSDTQDIQGKQFVKKSGWRKLAVVMGVSCEIVSRDYQRDAQGRITSAEVIIRAIAPNGRSQDGLGVCDFHERCCPRAFGVEGQEPPPVCRQGGRHTHCPPGCDGFNHFSKPQHDLPATAATRAQNRACSDLFGFGEVSAEEITDRDEPVDDADVQAIIAALNSIPDKAQRFQTKTAFGQRFGRPDELKKGQVEAARRFVRNAGGSFTDPADGAPPGRATSTHSEPTAPQDGAGADEGPSGSEAGDAQGSVSVAATPASPAGSAPPPPPPEKPSTAQQRRTIGMTFRELVAEQIVLESDKAEIVAIISRERATSTTQITFAEAVKVIACLHFLRSGALKMENDPDKDGARMLKAVEQPGTSWLAKLGEEVPA